MKASSLASRPDSLVCPFCEMGQLRSSSHDLMRCQSCEGHLSGAVLQTLRQISALPDALGSHACEECATLRCASSLMGPTTARRAARKWWPSKQLPESRLRPRSAAARPTAVAGSTAASERSGASPITRTCPGGTTLPRGLSTTAATVPAAKPVRRLSIRAVGRSRSARGSLAAEEVSEMG
jgi:hypothetical protein